MEQLTEIKNTLDEYHTSVMEKTSTMKARLDELEARQNRPGFGGGGTIDAATAEHKAGFDLWLRHGEGENTLRHLEAKAFNVATPADGGYAVPEEIDRQIEKLVREVSPIRAIAGQITVGTSDFKKLVNTGGTASGWVSESAARPETATPTFAEVVPPIGEIYANPAVTQRALDDMFIDAGAMVADEIGEEFSVQESAAFINGNGTNRPRGFLTGAIASTGDDSRAFGTLQYVPTGADGAFAASDAHEVLFDVEAELKPRYRAGAVWVMSSKTLNVVRKMKDGDGNLLWNPNLQSGAPATLLGYGVTVAEDMPDIGSDSLSIAFGNFRRGYLIVDRTGTRLMRDPYTNRPYVHFYATRRVGGALVNSEAIKLVKFGTA